MQDQERNPYLSSLPKASPTPSIFVTEESGTPGLASGIQTGGKIVGAVVGGVAGAYAGGPMGAVKGASAGSEIGGAATGAAVKTLSLDGKDRSLWERLRPDQKSLAAAQSLKGFIK